MEPTGSSMHLFHENLSIVGHEISISGCNVDPPAEEKQTCPSPRAVQELDEEEMRRQTAESLFQLNSELMTLYHGLEYTKNRKACWVQIVQENLTQRITEIRKQIGRLKI